MGALFGVFFFRLQHVQVVTHGRVQGHVFQQLAEVAEGVFVEHVHVAGHGMGADVGRNVGNHKELQQGPTDAGTQQISATEPLLPNGFVAHFFRSAVLLFTGALRCQVTEVRHRGLVELLPQPALVAFGSHLIDLGHRACAKRGLGQKPRRIFSAGGCGGRGRCAATTAGQSAQVLQQFFIGTSWRCARRTTATAPTAAGDHAGGQGQYGHRRSPHGACFFRTMVR